MAELSLGAQAVLDAAYALPLKKGQPDIAAALRAVADNCINRKWSVEMDDLYRELYAIAAELEDS